MNDYFTGSALQLVERARLLRTKIPRNLPRNYDTLAQKCGERLKEIIGQLRSLVEEPLFQHVKYRPERLRQFRRLVVDLDEVETFAISALDRAINDDHQLNELIGQITREIRYPLITPVITTLSQQYFCIRPELNLLSVPLMEGRFLLHLPDLYHELCHPLLKEQDDPVVEPFQQYFGRAMRDVLAHLVEEIVKEDRRRGPQQWSFLLPRWKKVWVTYWLEEFFCDLFGVYTLGPAFAWAHLHLAAKRGGHPFEVPTISLPSHPADDARMRAMLQGLSRISFSSHAQKIEDKWQQLLNQSSEKPEPEYHRCYPEKIIQRIAELVYEGVTSIRCRIATPTTDDPVHLMLNKAWEEFWHNPEGYVEWERQTIENQEKHAKWAL